MKIPEECFSFLEGSVPLSCYSWQTRQPSSTCGSIVVIYSAAEAAGQFEQLLEFPDLQQFAIFACPIDEGQGMAAGSKTLPTLAKRLDALVRRIAKDYEIRSDNIAVIAHGMESAVAAVWLHDYAPAIRCLSLLSPVFEPGANSPTHASGVPVNRPNGWHQASSTPEVARFQAAIRRVVKDAQAIQIPIQILCYEGGDQANQNLVRQFFHNTLSNLKQIQVLQSQGGAVPGETVDGRAADLIRAFLARIYAEPRKRISMLEADLAGYTKDEFDRFLRPLPLFSQRRLRFAWEKILMRTIGRLSTGIRLGLEMGFDSGSTMDYVYRNQASGITRLGKAIDASYLNAAGWRAIRIRRRNLQGYIAEMSGLLQKEGVPLVIADIAAGPGRYVLEAVSKLHARPERLILRDYNATDVHHGRALIDEYQLEDIARFDQADAFDSQSLASMQPRPTLVIACGIYELFPENSMVRASLRGLAEAVPDGGVLIYTGQPWHPELEYLARVLPSHRRNHKCLTRRRTQDELDQLVESAGFIKIDQRIDEWGIFSVSVARRVR